MGPLFTRINCGKISILSTLCNKSIFFIFFFLPLAKKHDAAKKVKLEKSVPQPNPNKKGPHNCTAKENSIMRPLFARINTIKVERRWTKHIPRTALSLRLVRGRTHSSAPGPEKQSERAMHGPGLAGGGAKHQINTQAPRDSLRRLPLLGEAMWDN